MDKTLYLIEHEYLATIQELEEWCLENETDEIPEHFLERLNINMDEASFKIEDFVIAIRSIENSVVVLEELVDKLKKKVKRKEKTVEFLKSQILHAVQMFGKETASKNRVFKTNTFSVSAINKTKLAVTDIDALPDSCKCYQLKVGNIAIENLEEVMDNIADLGFIYEPDLVVDKTKLTTETPGVEVVTAPFIRIS